MELKQMWKIILRWWWLGAIPVIVVASHVTLTFQSAPLMYQVVTRFMAGGKPAAELSADYDRYHAWTSSEYIARGLANVAETGEFAHAVADRLTTVGVNIPPTAIQGAIISDYAESVIVIYLTWPDAEQIVLVAEAISEEITENGPAYFPQMGGIGTVARRADPPTVVTLPPSLKTQLLGPGLRVLLAGGVGLGLIFLVHYLDPMTRERSDIETLNVIIVGSIPKYRKN